MTDQSDSISNIFIVKNYQSNDTNISNNSYAEFNDLVTTNENSIRNPIIDNELIDIESLQQALIEGQDPTQIAPASAAGITTINNQLVDSNSGSEGNMPVPLLLRDGHETISSSGFNTEKLQFHFNKPYDYEQDEITLEDKQRIDHSNLSTFPNKTPSTTVDLNTSQPDDSIEPDNSHIEAPTILLSAVSSTSIFKTGFESINAQEKVFLNNLEGWQAGDNGKIEPWRQYGENETPNSFGYGKYAAHSGNNFIELNGKQTQHASLPDATEITRIVNTEPGGIYELSFYYSPRPKFDETVTQIEVLWDNQVVATISVDGQNLTNNEWQLFKFSLLGDGAPTNLTIRHAGGYEGGGRGAFIDDIQLTELVGGGTVVGYENTSIKLPNFSIEYVNTTDAENVQTFLRGVPPGSKLTDGVRTLEVGQADVDISGWSYNTLSLTPISDFIGNVDLFVDVVNRNDQTSLVQQSLRVKVLANQDYTTPIDNYLIAGSDRDIFVFAQDDQSKTDEPDTDVIVGFNVQQDVLDISDLLVNSDAFLDHYLSINFDNTDTVIAISPAANDSVKQNIVLKNVNLGDHFNTSDEAQLIHSMLESELLVA